MGTLKIALGMLKCMFGRHDFAGSRRIAWCRRPNCAAKLLRPL